MLPSASDSNHTKMKINTVNNKANFKIDKVTTLQRKKLQWAFNEIDIKRKLRNEYLLRVAVMTNNEEIVRECLLKDNVDVNCIDEHRRTPLHLAASCGYTPIVKLLLQFGADPSLKDSLGNTPLHLVSCTANVSVVKELLAFGADPKTEDGRGCSPIQLAQSRLRLLASWSKSASPDSALLMEQVQSVVDNLLACLDKSQAERVDTLHNQLANSKPNDHIMALLTELDKLTI